MEDLVVKLLARRTVKLSFLCASLSEQLIAAAGDSERRGKKSLPDDYEPDCSLGSPFPRGK